jgi:competence protein ComEA
VSIGLETPCFKSSVPYPSPITNPEPQWLWLQSNAAPEQGAIGMRYKLLSGIVSILWMGVAWAQVDLNHAKEMDLDGLNGVGPTMTREIMRERQKTPFRDWADVMQRVKGIGPKKAASLSEQGVRVQGQGYGQAPPTSPRKP